MMGRRNAPIAITASHNIVDPLEFGSISQRKEVCEGSEVTANPISWFDLTEEILHSEVLESSTFSGSPMISIQKGLVQWFWGFCSSHDLICLISGWGVEVTCQEDWAMGFDGFVFGSV